MLLVAYSQEQEPCLVQAIIVRLIIFLGRWQFSSQRAKPYEPDRKMPKRLCYRQNCSDKFGEPSMLLIYSSRLYLGQCTVAWKVSGFLRLLPQQLSIIPHVPPRIHRLAANMASNIHHMHIGMYFAVVPLMNTSYLSGWAKKG